MPLTVRDIAKVAGVSPATVSRYFSGSDVVSTDTARKIEGATKELGYTPKFKKCRDNGVIAVLIPDLQLGFYGEVLKELIEEIPKYNYRIVFIPTIPDSEHYKIFFKEMNIVGVIYLDESIDRDIINYISSKKIKTVMCAGGAFDSRSEMVHINDIAAAYEGTKYLISLGHEKILFLSDYLKNIGSSFQRFTGCKRALDEIGVDFNENEMLGCGPVTYENGYRLTKQFLEKKIDFTAIFAFSDEMAVGAISALHDFGLKVPEDVSVLGFDDIALASRILPRLTTVHQPIKEFVTKTLEAFQELDNANDKVEITLPYNIVKRGTCIENKGVNIYENRGIGILVSGILRQIYLIFFVLISIGPLLWIVMSSFKTNKEILSSAFALPSNLSFSGYSAALELAPIFKFYGNSLFIALISTMVNILVVSMAAYILARCRFRGKTFLTLLLSSSLLIPTSSLLMPIYIIMTKIGLYDTKTGLIIVYAALGLPSSLFVIKSYFQGIPVELEEAAYLDGASFTKTYFSIVFPIAKSGLATAAILQFLTSWNEFMFALILTKSTSARTLPLALNYFTSQFSFNYTAMFAALAMVIIPSILIYTLLQEQVTDSMVAGSIKG